MSQSAKQSTIKDMTTGSPAKLILGFAIPMLMGLLFQQFYSMVHYCRKVSGRGCPGFRWLHSCYQLYD